MARDQHAGGVVHPRSWPHRRTVALGSWNETAMGARGIAAIHAIADRFSAARRARKSGVYGKSVSVCVDLGGSRILKKTTMITCQLFTSTIIAYHTETKEN